MFSIGRTHTGVNGPNWRDRFDSSSAPGCAGVLLYGATSQWGSSLTWMSPMQLLADFGAALSAQARLLDSLATAARQPVAQLGDTLRQAFHI
jgi:hypothetical protein